MPIHEGTADDLQVLKDMGYEQDLFRGLGGWFANFAFTFVEVSFISSYSIVFNSGLTIGGPSVMIWGWIIGSIFNIMVGLSLAEICSVYPSAGSVYHWTGQLASAEWAPLASYICGWLNWLGNACGDAGFASGFAAVVAGLASFNGVTLETGPQTGIAIAILFGWTLLNLFRVDQQAWVNMFAAVYQMICTIVIILVVLIASPDRSNAQFVFTKWNDGTGLEGSNDGYVLLLGLLTTLFTFCGYEAGGHMAEETVNARKSAPRGIVATVISVAVFGLIYCLGLLFSIPHNDLDIAINGYYPIEVLTPVPQDIMDQWLLDPNSTCDNSTILAGYRAALNCTIELTGGEDALLNIFTFAVGSTGAFGLYMLLLFNLFFAGMSSVTITSRITFALARDGAFPGSEKIAYLSETTKSPVVALWFVFFFDAIILLLDIANEATFLAIIALTTIGFQLSYSIPIFCRLVFQTHTFVQGPWNLGKASIPIGTLGVIWLWFTSIIFFWPTEFPVDETNMNYAVVVVGIVAVVAAVYWALYARHHFLGPKREEKSEVKD
eukprot:TRINITY_DN17390_c0_g1_i1.p1 TRINITY_DN17390_c0_g1~~TRINITY_DN17390_c0_g1_i1.p1  ORF type:complete len:550 (+),score=49.13 TRINITY_DN17390_c0_g1_i1:40-1689(+)